MERLVIPILIIEVVIGIIFMCTRWDSYVENRPVIFPPSIEERTVWID